MHKMCPRQIKLLGNAHSRTHFGEAILCKKSALTEMPSETYKLLGDAHSRKQFGEVILCMQVVYGLGVWRWYMHVVYGNGIYGGGIWM